MLYYSPQISASDNTDAITRVSIFIHLTNIYSMLVQLKIQYGTSIAYPTSCIGSHVSTIPNHITGNKTRSRTRGIVALCGTFGFDLDMFDLSVYDRSLYQELVSIYRVI